MIFDPTRLVRPDWRAGDSHLLLRPWWGMNPVKLIVRAVLQGIISIIALVVLLRVRSGEYLPDDAAIGDARSSIVTGALVLAIFAGIWFLFSILRLAVGVLDLPGRKPVQGRVISISERRSWDFLPAVLQHMIWNRRDQGYDDRRRGHILVVDTDDGQRAWKLRYSRVRDIEPGQSVRVVATPINGYVRSVKRNGPTDA